MSLELSTAASPETEVAVQVVTVVDKHALHYSWDTFVEAKVFLQTFAKST